MANVTTYFLTYPSQGSARPRHGIPNAKAAALGTLTHTSWPASQGVLDDLAPSSNAVAPGLTRYSTMPRIAGCVRN